MSSCMSNKVELQYIDESCRVRQALHCILLKIYKYVAEHEGIAQGKHPIKKETISSKLITQIFDGSEKFIDALQQYYRTRGADRTLEIEVLNHVSKSSRKTTARDTAYVRDRFNEIRELYDLDQ